MAWVTPKTDWTVGTRDTSYNGSRFTYVDFNRIKNNILYMYEFAQELYPIDDEIARREANSRTWAQTHSGVEDYFILIDGYADRTVHDFIYADEMNYFEERIDFLNSTIGSISNGTKQRFYDNSLFPNAAELNRLETLSLRINDFLQNKYIGRRKLAFVLSQRNNHIDL